MDEERYLDFSNERRETVLRYSEEYKKRLSYYYDNWAILVDPYNIKLRLVMFLKTIGILEFARKAKKMLLSRLEVLQKA